MSEMQKTGVTDFISELKHVENCTDLKKNWHRQFRIVYRGLWLKISKVIQQRQMMLVIFYRGGSVG